MKFSNQVWGLRSILYNTGLWLRGRILLFGSPKASAPQQPTIFQIHIMGCRKARNRPSLDKTIPPLPAPIKLRKHPWGLKPAEAKGVEWCWVVDTSGEGICFLRKYNNEHGSNVNLATPVEASSQRLRFAKNSEYHVVAVLRLSPAGMGLANVQADCRFLSEFFISKAARALCRFLVSPAIPTIGGHITCRLTHNPTSVTHL